MVGLAHEYTSGAQHVCGTNKVIFCSRLNMLHVYGLNKLHRILPNTVLGFHHHLV